MAKALHAESALRIPLVRHLLEDPAIQLVKRGIDNNWFYQQCVPQQMTGFNPFFTSVFYPATSTFGSGQYARTCSASRPASAVAPGTSLAWAASANRLCGRPTTSDGSVRSIAKAAVASMTLQSLHRSEL
jgi:hypothetical protein